MIVKRVNNVESLVANCSIVPCYKKITPLKKARERLRALLLFEGFTYLLLLKRRLKDDHRIQ